MCRIVRLTFHVFLFCLISCACNLSVQAQSKAYKTESDVLNRLAVLSNDPSVAPFKKIDKIVPLLELSRASNWREAELFASILRLELLVETEDNHQAARLLPAVNELAREANAPESHLKLDLIALALKDANGLTKDIKKFHATLLKKASSLENKRLAADIYLAVGLSEYTQSEYAKAIITLKRAFDLYEQVQDKQGAGDVFNALANVNNDLGYTDLALEYLAKALTIARDVDDQFGMSVILYNMSNSHSFSGNYKKAKEYMHQSLKISVSLQDDIGIGWATKKLADIYLREENWQLAVDTYLEAESVFKTTDNIIVSHDVAVGLAEAYFKLGRLDEAQTKAELGRTFLKNTPDSFNHLYIQNLLADIEYARSNYKSAFDMLSANYDAMYNLFMAENDEEIEKYRIEFDSEVKERENKALAIEVELNSARIAQQNAAEQVWYVAAILGSLLIFTIGYLLILQTKNRDYFKSISLNDHLTNSPNRRAILLSVERGFDESVKTKELLSIALVDLDNFKLINDRNGHDAGDRVLKAFAQACKLVLRKSDQFGRYGGEEWLIVLHDVEPAYIDNVFSRVRSEINKTVRDTLPAIGQVTFSMGVASYDGSSDKTMQAVINQADENLYKAKARGKDQVVY